MESTPNFPEKVWFFVFFHGRFVDSSWMTHGDCMDSLGRLMDANGVHGEKGSLRLRLRFGLRQQGARLTARAFPCGLKSALPRLKPEA
jgi:hypothetical protein